LPGAPPQAAGLRFEEDEHRRMALDAQIAADAVSAPGVLPLLSTCSGRLATVHGLWSVMFD
jgi:hypothetical protein